MEGANCKGTADINIVSRLMSLREQDRGREMEWGRLPLGGLVSGEPMFRYIIVPRI